MTDIREKLSGILLACAGDTKQYNQTIDALEQVLQTYLVHLTRESVRVSETPEVIKYRDVHAALSCDPQLQLHVDDIDRETKELKILKS